MTVRAEKHPSDDATARAPFRADAYQGRRALVLGASGFIGRWVARRLSAQGADVFLVVRDSAAAEPLFARYAIRGTIIEQDLSRLTEIEPLVRQLQPTITFNLAGYGVDRAERNPEQAYSINASLVEAVCEAMGGVRDPAWAGQDIVHVGSALEYGTIGGNLAEACTPNPTTLYGQSKLAGTRILTQACRAHGMKGVTARLFTVYGPGEHPGRLLPALLETAKTHTPLALTAGKQKRDFTYVEDVADGLLRLGAATAEPGEVINLATGRLAAVRRFIEVAAAILDLPARSLELGRLPTRSEEMEHDAVTVERLRRRTGWTPPTTIEAGIRQTLAFVERREPTPQES